MFYTYTKKGYIVTVEGSNNKIITSEEAIKWTEGYLQRLVKRIAKASEVVEEAEEAEEVEMTEPLELGV
jgi:hypothetical protein